MEQRAAQLENEVAVYTQLLAENSDPTKVVNYLSLVRLAMCELQQLEKLHRR